MTYAAGYLVGHDYMQKWAPYNNRLAKIALDEDEMIGDEDNNFDISNF